jgi:hypothetical protein
MQLITAPSVTVTPKGLAGWANLEFIATTMTCGQPRWRFEQRVAKGAAVEVRQGGETVSSTAALLAEETPAHSVR